MTIIMCLLCFGPALKYAYMYDCYSTVIPFWSIECVLTLYYTEFLNKKETGTNMPGSLKLDLNNFGYYLLEGYLFFVTEPRNVGSVMSLMNTSTLKTG